MVPVLRQGFWISAIKLNRTPIPNPNVVPKKSGFLERGEQNVDHIIICTWYLVRNFFGNFHTKYGTLFLAPHMLLGWCLLLVRLSALLNTLLNTLHD